MLFAFVVNITYDSNDLNKSVVAASMEYISDPNAATVRVINLNMINNSISTNKTRTNVR